MYRTCARQERMTRELFGEGGEKGGGYEGEWGASRNIYKLKVMQGGRSTPFVCPCRRGIILHSAGSR